MSLVPFLRRPFIDLCLCYDMILIAVLRGSRETHGEHMIGDQDSGDQELSNSANSR